MKSATKTSAIGALNFLYDAKGLEIRTVPAWAQRRLHAIHPDLKFVWNRTRARYQIWQFYGSTYDGPKRLVCTLAQDPATGEIVEGIQVRHPVTRKLVESGVFAPIDERIFRILEDPNRTWNPKRDSKTLHEKAARFERIEREKEERLRKQRDEEDAYWGRQNVDLWRYLMGKGKGRHVAHKGPVMRESHFPSEARESLLEIQAHEEERPFVVIDKRRVKADASHQG